MFCEHISQPLSLIFGKWSYNTYLPGLFTAYGLKWVLHAVVPQWWAESWSHGRRLVPVVPAVVTELSGLVQ